MSKNYLDIEDYQKIIEALNNTLNYGLLPTNKNTEKAGDNVYQTKTKQHFPVQDRHLSTIDLITIIALFITMLATPLIGALYHDILIILQVIIAIFTIILFAPVLRYHFSNTYKTNRSKVVKRTSRRGSHNQSNGYSTKERPKVFFGKEQSHSQTTINEGSGYVIGDESIIRIDNISIARTPSENISDTLSHLRNQRQERLNQAHVTFIISITALALGILLIFIGIICVFTISFQIGTVTACASVIADIISGLAFVFNKDANDRLDTVTNDLSTIEQTDMAMHYIGKISDKTERDGAIKDLINNLYAQKSQIKAKKS